MTDRKNWPWRRKISSNNRLLMSSHAVDAQNSNSNSAFPAWNPYPSLEPRKESTPALDTGFVGHAFPMRSAENSSILEKRRHIPLLESAEALDDLETEDNAELQTTILANKLEQAEKDLVSKEAMVKQHAKVAEDAISGWEKSEAEALTLKQELGVLVQQKTVLDRRLTELDEFLKSSNMRVTELEEALKLSSKQLRQIQEDQQHKIQEAMDVKTQEWAKVKKEMREVEEHLRQCMLVAEARSCAMAKSLEERARLVTESQEAKVRAETEVGLLQVRLESQATEMASVRYEMHMSAKELDIRNKENEYGRKAVEASHKQHLEDVNKITKLEAECKRLRNLVRRRLPGPAAIAQMRIEADKTVQNGRRSILGSSGLCISKENATISPDFAEKLRAVEEEANILRETLANKSAELDSLRLICANTASNLLAEEDNLDSLQSTPKIPRSTQTGALESFVLRSQAVYEANSDRLHDEVSCAESWASALISELAQFKKPKHFRDICTLDSTSEGHLETQNKPLRDGNSKLRRPGAGARNSPLRQDFLFLRTLAGKDEKLQSANLMCKNAMAKLAAAADKLRGTWMSENPRSNVEESAKSVVETQGLMSKLDTILDDICIAAASVGDTTDGDCSDNGLATPCTAAIMGGNPAVGSGLDSLKKQLEEQSKTVDELTSQVSMLETSQKELQSQLHVKEDELKQAQSELVDASHQIEQLKVSELNLRSEQEKIRAEENAKRSDMQTQIEVKQNEMTELHNNLTSLRVELSEERKKHDAAVAKCEELDKKLQSYVDTECDVATSYQLKHDLILSTKKEEEVTAAKEKLAECQRTILLLGKQLSAYMSPSSASFDSTMSLQCGILDTNHYQDGNHASKARARPYQQKSVALKSVASHANHPNNHNSDHLAMKQPLGNGVLHSNPRRIHSDLSYRRGSKHLPVCGMFSVAEHLQMDDGLLGLYDSGTESGASSPSSQHTSPGETIRMHRSRYENRVGKGVRSSLAKSLECAVVPTTTGDSDGGISCQMVDRKSQLSIMPGTKNNGNDGGKTSKSLSRFFGRSRK